MTKTLQNSLLSLLLTSSLSLAKPHTNLVLLNANEAVTITDFDEGDNGEV